MNALFYRLRSLFTRLCVLTLGIRSERLSVISLQSILVYNKGTVKIGKNTLIRSGLRIDCQRGAEINIGNNVLIERNLHISSVKRISIGDSALLASNIYISDHTHNISSEVTVREAGIAKVEETVIRRGVWIGNNVVIMPGITIAENAIIGANSVVTRDVGMNEVWAGVPAKFLKVR